MKKKINSEWIIKATLIGFLISLIFTLGSEIALKNVSLLWGIGVALFFITLGVIFDMLGTAITAAKIQPFNSMAAAKIKGGKTAVCLIKNASKVASFLNDIVGDICGIISGSIGLVLAISIHQQYNINLLSITLLTTSIIAALTIGGKALGKELAINQNVFLISKFAKLLAIFKNEK